MTRLVALLGGINVGGHRVTMDRLRDEVGALGFSDVSTFIASGNILFSSVRPEVAQEHERAIEAHLAARLGWPVPTFVRTPDEIAAAAALQPFGPQADGYTHMVAFCRSAPDTAIEAHGTPRDRFLVNGREVHWLIEGGVSTSAMTLPRLVKLIGANTTRNVTTVGKLSRLLAAPG